MNGIARAERQAKKSKPGKRGQGSCERFGKVFERHEFAIDSPNPKFKSRENVKKALEGGRKRRKRDTEALN